MLRWSQPTKFPGWFQKVLSRGRDASSPGRNFKKHHIIPADSAAATLPRWRVYLKAPTYFVYPRTRSAARCITRWTRSMCSRPATDSRPGSVTIAQLSCAISVGWMCQTRANRPCSDSDSLDLRRRLVDHEKKMFVARSQAGVQRRLSASTKTKTHKLACAFRSHSSCQPAIDFSRTRGSTGTSALVLQP